MSYPAAVLNMVKAALIHFLSLLVPLNLHTLPGASLLVVTFSLFILRMLLLPFFPASWLQYHWQNAVFAGHHHEACLLDIHYTRLLHYFQ